MTKITLQGITEQDFVNLLGVTELPVMGTEVELPCRIKVISATSNSQKFVESQVFNFLVDTLSTISIGILSAYIYDALRNVSEKAKIKINDEIVKNDEKEINTEIMRCCKCESESNINDDNNGDVIDTFEEDTYNEQ